MILFLLFFYIPNVQAAEESKDTQTTLSAQELVDQQLKSLDISELQQYWEDITNKYGGFFPESQKGSLYDFFKGDKKFSFKEWGQGILKFAFHEFVANGKLLGSLIMLAMLSFWLRCWRNAFERRAC